MDKTEKKIIAFELGALCAIAAVIGGCVRGIDYLEKRSREQKMAKIRSLATQYKDGLTLIGKESTTSSSYLYLDADGNPRTTEVVMSGTTKLNAVDKCLWREVQPGDKKSIEAWAKYLYNPTVDVVTEKMRQRD